MPFTSKVLVNVAPLPLSGSAYMFTLWGTSGCHLCEVAQLMLQQLSLATKLTWRLAEVMDLPATQLSLLAPLIPCVTDAAGDVRLAWPFSLLELQDLADALPPNAVRQPELPHNI